MTAQLELIDGHRDWQLDEQARDAGRRGVERARAALAEARRRMHDDAPSTGDLARTDRAA